MSPILESIMKRWHQTLLLGIVEIGLILLLHQVLMRQMAERQIVAQIIVLDCKNKR